MVSITRLCVIVIFAALAAPRLFAQNGGSAVTLTATVSPFVAVSAGPPVRVVRGDALISPGANANGRRVALRQWRRRDRDRRAASAPFKRGFHPRGLVQDGRGVVVRLIGHRGGRQRDARLSGGRGARHHRRNVRRPARRARPDGRHSGFIRPGRDLEGAAHLDGRDTGYAV
jgi:hypothetical protein